ncbi:MAG: hypothetical protein QOJ16_4590, partial [Acidobacteriota bacterium]|nr:hypothetical protein [Acidobacteriota bacterium]
TGGAGDSDRSGLGTALAERLRAAGARVTVVTPGDPVVELGKAGEPAFTRIVHLWSLDAGTPERDRELGFHSLLSLVHALAARVSPEDPGPLAHLRALVVGSGLARMTADDPLRPELAPLAALCQLLPRELPGIVCRAVDTTPPASPRRREQLVEALLAEILAPAEPPALAGSAAVAFRGGERWVRAFEPLPLPSGEPGASGTLVELNDLGDEVKVKGTLAAAARTGGIAGVVVQEGLGLDLPELPVPLATRERLDEVLAAAGERLATLARLLAEHSPGFCLLRIGLAARSGPGRILAAAVDSLVAAFAEQQSEEGLLPWAVLHQDPDEESAGEKPGPAALLSLLARGTVRLVASPEEPGAWIERLRAVATGPAEPETAARGVTLHARPNLRNPYVPPSTDTERGLAEIWRKLLGIEAVGIHDSFFDLGGDSLLGTQVITRVRDTWGVDLPLPALFELPTPAALAERIESLRPEGETEGEKIARMLAKLESLSPEEVERMLAERGAGP